jgi:hypothetical protein
MRPPALLAASFAAFLLLSGAASAAQPAPAAWKTRSLADELRLDGAPFHRHRPGVMQRSGLSARTGRGMHSGLYSPVRAVPDHIRVITPRGRHLGEEVRTSR